MTKQYVLTRDDLLSITEGELVFGTMRLLPTMEQIPPEFFIGNIYTAIAQAMFVSNNPPPSVIAFRKGFDNPDAVQPMLRCLTAHLKSWGPKHEHKIAGIGYMISLICDIRPV